MDPWRMLPDVELGSEPIYSPSKPTPLFRKYWREIAAIVVGIVAVQWLFHLSDGDWILLVLTGCFSYELGKKARS